MRLLDGTGTALDGRLGEALRAKLAAGLVPQWILSDPEVFDREVRRIFARTWYYLGHESELANAGDYVTRWYVNDPVLLTRTPAGEIKAYLNSCMHRGTILCSADSGNKANFTCPYHGWTYNHDGKLIGIVAGNTVYGAEMERERWALRSLPRVESYHGLIFASLDPEVESLEDYLGDLTWYLDILVARTDGGMQVYGPPVRWRVNANWKIGAENFIGDSYHTATTHRSTVEIGLSPKDPLFASYGHQIVIEGGHGLNISTPSPHAKNSYPYQGLPEQMWPAFARNLTAEQLDVFRSATVFNGTVFPNLSFLSPMHGAGGDAHLTNFLTLRQWRPIGPDRMEIWSWLLADVDAPEDFKQESYKRYVNSFGPAGTLEQDDVEIWTRITEASKGLMARDKDLSYNNIMNYVMGVNSVDPDESWVGPGVAYPTCYLEAAHRGFYTHWNDLMSAPVATADGE